MIRKRSTARGPRYDVRLRRPDGSVYTKTFRIRSDADRWERAEIRARDRGDWIDPSARATKLADWVEEWLAQPGRSAATVTDYRQILEHDVLPRLAGHSLGAITPGDVQGIVNEAAARVSAHTTQKIYRTLKACLNAAVAADLLARSPCRGVRLPSVRTEASAPAEFSAVDEIAAYLAPESRIVVYLAGYEGLRRGEIFGLRVADIDWLAGVLHVRRAATEVRGEGVVIGPPKTSQSVRSIRLLSATRDALATHLALRSWNASDGDRYLVGPGDGLKPRNPNNFFRTQYDPARKAAGFPNLNLHDLRRLAATELVSAGVDPRTVQARLGHASFATTMKYYARVTADAEERAVELLEKRLLARPARDIRAMGQRGLRPDAARQVIGLG